MGTAPMKDGVLLKPDFMIGEFSDLKSKSDLCDGKNIWKVAHGDPLVHSTYWVQLVSESSKGGAYSSAIKRPFNFEKGKEYVLSMEVFNSHRNDGEPDRLEAYIANDIPTRACGTDINAISLPSAQKIMILPYEKYKKSYDESKWWTFAIKFIPQQNYNTIYIRLVPKYQMADAFTSYGPVTTMIDKIGIHTKGHFNNPQAEDVVKISDFNETPWDDENYTTQWNTYFFANTAIYVGGFEVDTYLTNGQYSFLMSKKISLRPGFRAMRGSQLRATANDCIQLQPDLNPIGPLDHNVVSQLRSIDETDSIGNEAQEFTIDYSYLDNYYKNEVSENLPYREEEEAISLIPNPASSTVIIRCIPFIQNFEVALHDLTGKKVFTKHVNDNFIELDVRNFPKGFYIIECRQGQRVYYGRLVIQ
jgi:hypothetical protein